MKRYIKPHTEKVQITERSVLMEMSLQNLGNYNPSNPQLGKEWADVFVTENDEGLPCFSVWED